MRYHATGMALITAIVLAACQGDPGADAAAEDDQEEEAPPVPVETAYPQRGDIYAVYSGTAPIEAFAEADVIAKVDGEVQEILVEEGDDVARSQVLARLDGQRLRLELAESEARLNKLRRDYQRNLDLRDKDLISEGDFEKIKYEMEALEASYNLASLELDYTKIRSPINGVVAERYVKLGNTVDVGEPLFRVTSLDPLVAYLFVPERQYRRIEPGQPVAIGIDALGGQPIGAAVSRVSPVVDPDTGTFKITVEIDDPERRIKPGMFGRISIVYDQRANALKIPRAAIVEDGGANSVFVVENGLAIRKDVEIGYSDRGMVEILSGLDDDEAVITIGQSGLRNEAKVTVIDGPGGSQTPPDDDVKVSDNAPTD